MQRLVETVKRTRFIDNLGSKELVTRALIGIAKLQQGRIAGGQMDDQKRNQRDAQQRGNNQ